MNGARTDLGRGRELASAVLYLMCRWGVPCVFFNYTVAELELISRTDLSAGDGLNKTVHAFFFFKVCMEVTLCIFSPTYRASFDLKSYSLHPDSCSLNKEE